MSEIAAIFASAIAEVWNSAAAIPDDLNAIKALDDTSLLSTQRSLAELRRMIESRESVVAGEVAFRSRRDLGYSGLAQREGYGSAEKLIQSNTGSTGREASTLIAVGTLVHEALIDTVADPQTGELPSGFVVGEPWLAAVGAAVAAGSLTLDKARSIKFGLGVPSLEVAPPCTPNPLSDSHEGNEVESSGVTADDLAKAASRLLQEAPTVNADRLYSLARRYRDELDIAGIAVRENSLHAQRSFRRTLRQNGLPRFTIDPDLETSSYLDDLYNKLMAPRRSGPRFIDPDDVDWAKAIQNDERSNDQYLHDAFTALLKLGVDADLADRNYWKAKNGGLPTSPEEVRASRARIVGSRVPAVRLLVTESALSTRRGSGHIEGSNSVGGASVVSLESVERAICSTGTIPIRFSDQGSVLELGRETRLFSGPQKIALSVRDGGCLWPECDKPPSWTEAHHINHWARDNGRTDISDGVLLCRFHHMLAHNNHWEIMRRENTYWLIPPPEIDKSQTARELRSQSAVLREQLREHSHEKSASVRIEQLVS